jgi:hypothetical protein
VELLGHYPFEPGDPVAACADPLQSAQLTVTDVAATPSAEWAWAQAGIVNDGGTVTIRNSALSGYKTSLGAAAGKTRVYQTRVSSSEYGIGLGGPLDLGAGTAGMALGSFAGEDLVLEGNQTGVSIADHDSVTFRRSHFGNNRFRGLSAFTNAQTKVGLWGCSISGSDVGLDMSRTGWLEVAQSTTSGNKTGIHVGNTGWSAPARFIADHVTIAFNRGSAITIEWPANVHLENSAIGENGAPCTISGDYSNTWWGPLEGRFVNVTDDASCFSTAMREDPNHTVVTRGDLGLSPTTTTVVLTFAHYIVWRPGHPLIDRSSRTFGVDQHGNTITDDNGDGVPKAEIGAVEYRAARVPSQTVTTSGGKTGGK